MYRLIIVDDEELELEGMSQLVPWDAYNTAVVGTAENGQQALELIHEQNPDIVITDIQMPVMNGLELICNLREEKNPAEIIVLSGYGDYKYTSKAMEYGIRHYLMKPFDEEKIAVVMEAVENEILKKRNRATYDENVRKLLPRAKEQIFRNILLKRCMNHEDYRLLLREFGNSADTVYLLAFRKMKSVFDDMEQFVTGNMLEEQLGKNIVLLSTQIRNDLLYLMRKTEQPPYESIRRTLKKLQGLDQNKVVAAMSRSGKTEDAALMYEQIEQLYRMQKMFEGDEILSYDSSCVYSDERERIFDFKQIDETDSFNQIVALVYSGYLKMAAHEYDWKQMKELSVWFTGLFLENEEMEAVIQQVDQAGTVEDLYKIVAESIAIKRGVPVLEKGSEKLKRIMYAAFDNMKNPELNTRFLSNEVLFMNEDYFSRIYQNLVGERFSSNLVSGRIWYVKELLEFDPDLRLTKIAELVGFAPDGQYLSKAFRKQEGMTPSEYRKKVKEKR